MRDDLDIELCPRIFKIVEQSALYNKNVSKNTKESIKTAIINAQIIYYNYHQIYSRFYLDQKSIARNGYIASSDNAQRLYDYFSNLMKNWDKYKKGEMVNSRSLNNQRALFVKIKKGNLESTLNDIYVKESSVLYKFISKDIKSKRVLEEKYPDENSIKIVKNKSKELKIVR